MMQVIHSSAAPEASFHRFELPQALALVLMTQEESSIAAHVTPGSAAWRLAGKCIALADAAFRHFSLSAAPSRPVVIPLLDPQQAPSLACPRLLAASPGMVLSEGYRSIASIRFLLDLMPALQRAGVDTLYLDDLLTDVHQADLERFHQTGRLPAALKAYLDQQGPWHHDDPDGRYSLRNLIEGAGRHGMRVGALTCLASSGLQGWSPQRKKYFAMRVIGSREGAGKWLALTGNDLGVGQEQLAGLAELCGGISLRIMDGILRPDRIEPWRGPDAITDFILSEQTPVATVADSFPPSLFHLLQAMAHRAGVTPDERLAYPGVTEPERAAISEALRLQQAYVAQAVRSLALAPRAPRPILPAFDPDISVHEMIGALLSAAPGIAIGETHGDCASHQLLIEHMAEFKAQGVDTLFLEHVLNESQADLDRSLSNGFMPPALRLELDQQDRASMLARGYGTRKVIKTARRHGIRVFGLDGLPAAVAEQPSSDPWFLRRMFGMNYLAMQLIRRQSGRGKWLALMGAAHIDRFESVPGVAELTGAISLRIAPGAGHASQVQRDRGEMVGGSVHLEWVQGDFVLADRAPASEAALNAQLTHAGDFQLRARLGNDRAACRYEIHYRNRQGERVVVAVRSEALHYAVDRPDWPGVHQRLFPGLGQLCSALRQYGYLTRIAAPGVFAPLRMIDAKQVLTERSQQRNLSFKRQKDALLMRMSVLASTEQQAEFKAGKRRALAELAGLQLADATLPELKHWFVEARARLSFAQNGAILQRIHSLQTARLNQLADAWRVELEACGASGIKRLSHNLYLASNDRQQGVCAALTAQLAAVWLQDAEVSATSVHLDHYLRKVAASIDHPEHPSARILGLSLLEWSYNAPEAKFGAHPARTGLNLDAVLDTLSQAEPPAVFQLSFGEHALMLGVRMLGAVRHYAIADPNYGYAELAGASQAGAGLALQADKLRKLAREMQAGGAAATLFGLRQFRRDLAAQPIWIDRGPLCLADLGREQELSILFNQGAPLERDAFFLRQQRRLTIAEYRQRLSGRLAGMPLDPFLIDLLKRHNPRGVPVFSGALMMKIGFDASGNHAQVLLKGQNDQDYPRLAIDGAEYPQDVAFLRQYQDFLDQLSGDSAIDAALSPPAALCLDTLYLASPLFE